MPPENQLNIEQTFESQKELVTQTIIPVLMKTLDLVTYLVGEDVVYDMIHRRHRRHKKENNKNKKKIAEIGPLDGEIIAKNDFSTLDQFWLRRVMDRSVRNTTYKENQTRVSNKRVIKRLCVCFIRKLL